MSINMNPEPNPNPVKPSFAGDDVGHFRSTVNGADGAPREAPAAHPREAIEHFGNQLRSTPMHLAENLKSVVDSISDLMVQHIKLARVELKEDARVIGIEVGKILAFVPLLMVGYLILGVAAALFLHRYMAADVAFLIVATFNLTVGGVGIFLAVKKLQARQVMNDTRAEIESTALALRTETAVRTPP